MPQALSTRSPTVTKCISNEWLESVIAAQRLDERATVAALEVLLLTVDQLRPVALAISQRSSPLFDSLI